MPYFSDREMILVWTENVAIAPSLATATRILVSVKLKPKLGFLSRH